MKKLFLLLIFVFPAFLFSESITLEYDFGLPKVQKADGYSVLKVPGLKNHGNPGHPVLPHKTIEVLVPFGKKVGEIQVTGHGKTFLKGTYDVKPGQRQVPLSAWRKNQTKKSRIPFTPPEPLIYGSNSTYPAKSFHAGSVQTLRGFQILPINIYPYRYTPSVKKIFYYKRVDVTVSFVEDDSETLKPERMLRRLPKDFSLIEDSVSNPAAAESYEPLQQPLETLSIFGDTGPYDYVVITSASLSPYFQPLINHKIQRGLTARIVTVEDIYAAYAGTDNQERIRNFIIDAYLNWNLNYALLGGDTEVVPARGVYGLCEGYEDTNILCDMYYGALDGNWDADEDGTYGEEEDDVDFFAEVFVGRAPVETETEVQNFVSKTVEYENSFGDENLKKVLFVGELLYDVPETWGGDFKDAIEPLFPTTYTIRKRYDKTGTFNSDGELIVDEINAGVHLINHMGHSDYWLLMWIGDWEFYDISEDPEDIMNEQKCFIYSQGCYAGAFDEGGMPGATDEAVGENFVTSQYGAFAVVLNSRYGWFQPGDIEASVSQQFDEEFWDAVFTENIKNLGRANQDSKEDNYGNLLADTTGGYKWVYFQLNVLGDPETSIGGSASRDGIVFFDKSKYSDGDAVGLTVMDMDLNADHEAADQVVIPVTLSGGDSENLVLDETSANTGIFEGVIPLSENSPQTGNGILEASDQEIITATYIDNDDGLGNTVTKTATASADFVAPQITNVEAVNVSNDSATISWNTDEQADSRVVYGITVPPGSSSNDWDFVTSHSLALSGLEESTTYFFKVLSGDEAGNITEDDNGGSYYSFTTKTAIAVFEDDIESGQGSWEVSFDASTPPGYNWYITGHFSNSGTHSWHYCREEWDPPFDWIFYYYPGVGTIYDPVPVHSYLTSPSIDLTSVSTARLSFWHLLSCGDGQWVDWGRVEITTDGGNTWTVIWDEQGTGAILREERIDLAPYVGNAVKIRFHFYCEEDTVSTVYPGWFVDDFKVECFEEPGDVISVSVNPVAWDLQDVSPGESRETAADYFTLENDGNVQEDFTIAASDGQNWNAGATPGTDIFSMKAKGGVLAEWTDISTSQTFKENIPASDVFAFGLQFNAPTGTSNGNLSDLINVTITATKSQ
ncbi:MAG: hypothetical protein JW957_04820 [Candidatus Omnitrophica bacterium]|nr:hypothetical protein [Candidatus Omnitrophota bacterium]